MKEARRKWRKNNPDKVKVSYRRKNEKRRRAYREKVYGKTVSTEEMTKDPYRRAKAAGYRSGLEVAIARQLEKLGVPFEYEPFKVPFIQPPKRRTYTPDYTLSNGITVESKGRMVTSDRQKHKWLKEQYPDLDLRFVFSNPRTTISKKSKTTYAMWADSHGFQWAAKKIPQEWIDEPVNEKSLAVLKEITSGRADTLIKAAVKKLSKVYSIFKEK